MIKQLVLLALLLCAPAWAQLDWGPETFECGPPCGLCQDWVETPATITEGGATMTGSCWLDAGNAIWNVETGLSAAEMHWQFDLRADTSSGNSFFMRVLNAAQTVNQCQFFINSSNLVRINYNNGANSTSTSYTLTSGQIHTVETRVKQGTGSNAECQIRIDGGSWQGPTNGTWTDPIGVWDIRGEDTAHFDFDNISRCAAGAVGDGACDDTTPPVPGGSGEVMPSSAPPASITIEGGVQ